MEIITEGKAELVIPRLDNIPSKDMPVFYNPVMKHNRDIAVATVHAFAASRKGTLTIGLPLEGTGIRALRFKKEIPAELIGDLHINDLSPIAVQTIKDNLIHNNIDGCEVFQKDANLFLLESNGYHYIDIDPFGSPVPFLDAAMKRIARSGLLAVTATDTAALCGTYPDTCRRRYDAIPLRTAIMHEVGLRILIRKIQTIGMQYEKAFLPVLSYTKEHYFRTYGIVRKGVAHCDQIITQTGYIRYCKECQWHESTKENTIAPCPHCKTQLQLAGPLYLGTINDTAFIDTVQQHLPDDQFLQTLKEELTFPGFYYIPWMGKRLHVTETLPLPSIISKIKQKGYHASRTHFDLQSIKTDMPLSEFEKIIGK